MKKEKKEMQKLTKEEMGKTVGGGGKFYWVINQNGKLALVYK